VSESSGGKASLNEGKASLSEGKPSLHVSVARFRRQLAVSSLVQNGMLLLVVAGFILTVAPVGPRNMGLLILAGVAALWVGLGMRSTRSARAGDVASMIAAGRFAEAEDAIGRGLASFSIFRASRLMGLHQLVVLRHAQGRFAEVAELGQMLLRQRLGTLRGLAGSTEILLADALLELGDVAAAHRSLAKLYERRLSLGEATGLLRVQLDYLARVGAWQEMLAGVAEKIRLCELMPTTQAARAQKSLALAARNCGREELAKWLTERANLLDETEQRPVERGESE
jgi:hypothetical protein